MRIIMKVTKLFINSMASRRKRLKLWRAINIQKRLFKFLLLR